MGQSEILELLERENRWLTVREICGLLNQGQSSVSRVVSTLVQQGLLFAEDRYAPHHRTKIRHVRWKD